MAEIDDIISGNSFAAVDSSGAPQALPSTFSAETAQNDEGIEMQFAVMCMEKAETHFKLISSMRASTLPRLTKYVRFHSLEVFEELFEGSLKPQQARTTALTSVSFLPLFSYPSLSAHPFLATRLSPSRESAFRATFLLILHPFRLSLNHLRLFLHPLLAHLILTSTSSSLYPLDRPLFTFLVPPCHFPHLPFPLSTPSSAGPLLLARTTPFSLSRNPSRLAPGGTTKSPPHSRSTSPTGKTTTSSSSSTRRNSRLPRERRGGGSL
jgi:hypothetical protein